MFFSLIIEEILRLYGRIAFMSICQKVCQIVENQIRLSKTTNDGIKILRSEILGLGK